MATDGAILQYISGEIEVNNILECRSNIAKHCLNALILRLFYVDRVKGRVYVPVEHATLGQLLTENNAEIADTFDPIHIKHLAFFMLKCGDKKIGHNYRNRLAHWTEMKNSSLTVSLVAELLWLFTDVLNTIFAYYLGQAKLSDEDTASV